MIDKEHTGTCVLKKRGKQEKEQNRQEEYISLIPYTEKVTGITLTGFQYPLKNETLTIGISRGISNMLLEEKGSIQIEDGILMIICARD
jgi:thiamine pyrophosphokinase